MSSSNDEESDTEIKDPDRIHKYITVVFEVDNKENLDLYLNEEIRTPKIQKALQDKFNSKNALVVSSCRVLCLLCTLGETNQLNAKI
nr:2669_t:CDS:2 [Entrophospora candida]